MAKDTEKLIRQLSLISYLMAERRPVTAPEIRRDVEGYSAMNEDAFARRFYADRSELEALGILLAVEKPVDGLVEQETYSLPPENFHLPPIEFTDEELAALRTALQLLDGEFAYAEPLRLALQQISWGRPSPLSAPEQSTVALGITGSAGGHDVSQRLAKIETAIFRRKTVVFDYYTMQRDDLGTRRVDPYQLLYQGSQFYVVGRSHERDAIRVFRLSRIRGKVGYSTKAEHDFQRPTDFDPRAYASRIDWQFGESIGTAEIWIGRRIAWQIERHFGRYGEMHTPNGKGDQVFVTSYSNTRQLIAWVLGLGEHARILEPPELVSELRERVELLIERHTGDPRIAGPAAVQAPDGAERPDRPDPDSGNGHHPDSAIRPERFARLVTLASILISAGRAGRRLQAGELCRELGISDQELREDISVLNVVNFGAGHLRALRRDRGRRAGRGRPRALRGLVCAAGAAAAGRGQGADRRDRPDRRAHPRGLAGLGAQKVVAALGEDPVHEGLQMAPAERGRRRDRRGRLARDLPAAAAVVRVLQGERGRVLAAEGRAVRADQRPRGLVRRELRSRRARASATSAWIGSSPRR